MRAIVTGGAGFIGSSLVDALLARGDDVIVVDDLSTGRIENLPATADVVRHDVREPFPDVFAEHRPEVCFHLAAKVDVNASVERPHDDAAVNVVGTVNALAGAAQVGAKVVFASSGGAIYGEAPVPVDEDAPRLPLSPYGCAKLAAEEYVATYGRLTSVQHVSMRFANVYGPRQIPGTEAAVVGVFLTRLARGDQPRIFGDGSQTRDFVYVGDAVDAMLRAAERGTGVYNVGTGVSVSVLDLYDRCCAIAHSVPAAEFMPARAGEIHDNVLDAARARRELGWSARTDLGAGLAATWRWFVDGYGVTP
ncbi:MAG TPA: NAD-dependent epimerase/dehydratase family protein [Gaiellaceae bacterium]|jgi:UDP-glucose 4-epimerase|nr:NAD-dependent epimerase/dehydratase family protein [Gaiellaceae bacterium]